jgi:DNA-binding response OmpR family regulator
VVLVEDEAAVRELIAAYLTRQGYHVLTAGSGEEAVDGVRSWTEPPVLLISDIVMPGMNGRVLSDRLRLTHPQLKVLFVSGYTDDASVSNGSLAPGTHFLQKPFALSALAAKVTEIVGGD